MANTIKSLFEDENELDFEEEEAPKPITYRAIFTRDIYSTESCTVIFEAEEGTSYRELEDLAQNAYDVERYLDWHSTDSWDVGDTEISDIEEV